MTPPTTEGQRVADYELKPVRTMVMRDERLEFRAGPLFMDIWVVDENYEDSELLLSLSPKEARSLHEWLSRATGATP